MTTEEFIALLRNADPDGQGLICWEPETGSIDVMLGPEHFARVTSLGNASVLEPCSSCPWPAQCGERGECEAGA